MSNQDKLLSLLIAGGEIPAWDEVSRSRCLESLIDMEVRKASKKRRAELAMAARATPITKKQLVEAIRPGVVRRRAS